MSEKPYSSTPDGQFPSEPPPPYPTVGQSPYPPYPPQPYPTQPHPTTGYPAPAGPPPAAQPYYTAPPTTTYYPPPTSATTTVVLSGPAFGLGPHPVTTQCPHCNAQILTETSMTPGTLAWLICICCVFFGCIFGCCLIPFCVDDLQDVEHRCPQCKHFVGVHRRM